MASRVGIVLGVLVFLKLVVRFTLVGAFTPRVIEVFAIVDAAAVVLAAPWAASGLPRPARGGALRRALSAAALLTAGLAATNVLLQVPLMIASSSDGLEALIRTLTVGVPEATLAGPIGAFLLWLVAGGVGYGWLVLRLTPETPSRASRPVGGGRPDAASVHRPSTGARPSSAATHRPDRRPSR